MKMIIIPAYKPDETLINIVEEIEKYGYEIIVVNDGSGKEYDKIFEKIKYSAFILVNDTNQGKGYSIKKALKYIDRNFFFDNMTIGIMDADGQHNVEDMDKLLDKASICKGSLVIGSRKFEGDIPLKSKLGNKITRKIFQISTGLKVSDTQTGLRAFSKDLVKTFMDVGGNRYEYEMNVLYECKNKSIQIIEEPITTIYKDNNKSSHFRPVVDSLRIYIQIFKFVISSFMSFLVDYICFLILLFLSSKFVYGPLLSNIGARFISAGFNYTVNSKFVFKDGDKSKNSFSKYLMLAVFIFIMNNIIFSMLVYSLKIPAPVAKIMVEIILFIISFTIQNVFIFGTRKTLKNE